MNKDSSHFVSMRVQRRNEERRLAILRAASRVFRRRGFAAAGMREIAEEANLSPGNLYHYFNGKPEILFFCQERALERMQAAVDRARGSGDSAAAQLHAILRAHVHCVLDELEGASAHLEIEALPEELRRVIVERRDRYEQSVRTLVAEGVACGAFAVGDATLLTRAMLGAVNWTVRWYRPDGPQTVAEVATGLADYLVAGLNQASTAESALAAIGDRT